jgi:hypothetical protein
MNVPEEYAIGTLRLSVGRHTGPADVERGAACVVNAAIGAAGGDRGVARGGAAVVVRAESRRAGGLR